MNDPHHLMPCKAKPTEQMQKLLQWFESIGVHKFDVHLKKNSYIVSNTSEVTPVEKWIVCHENIDAHRIYSLWRWIKAENAHQTDIYFRPHFQESHPVIFLDDLNLAEAHRVARFYSCAVVQTSADNTHVWVKTTRPLHREERKAVQTHLSKKGFSDQGSVSGDHLGRMCGVMSHKRGCWVNAILFSTPRAYDPPLLDSTPHHGGGGARVLFSPGAQSPSEREFGWALGMLKAGMPHALIAQKIQQTAHQRGKRNAERYAILTVKKALAITPV